MAKKRVTRKQLLKEPDEFISFSNRMIRFAVAHKKQLVIAAGVFCTAVLVIVGVQYLSLRNQAKALNLLDNATARYGQTVARDGALKAIETVEKDFELILDKYASNAGGRLARVTFAQYNFEAGRPDKAIALYEASLEDFDSDSFYRGIILSGLGYAWALKGDTGKAISYFEQVASESGAGNLGDALFNLALLYEQAGQSSKSSELFKRIKEEYPASFYAEMASGKAAL